MIINKEEFCEIIASNANITKKAAREQVDSVFGAITDVLETGNGVQIVGFGKFDVVRTNPKTGINPQTKEKIKIPAKNKPIFKFGQPIKDAIANNKDITKKLSAGG